MTNSGAPSAPAGRGSGRERVECRNCSLFHICRPADDSGSAAALTGRAVERHRLVKRGERLLEAGEPFRCLYAVRSGSFKTYLPIEQGPDQVSGFQLPGEMIGLEALSAGVHPCGVQALEISSLCVLPFERLEEMSNAAPSIQHQILRLMSRQILSDMVLQALLCKKTAEQRLAAFLVSLSSRYGRRGFSATEFRLSMARHDIGSFLGLAEETVSRLFTRFQGQGLLSIERRKVILKKPHDLELIVGVPTVQQ